MILLCSWYAKLVFTAHSIVNIPKVLIKSHKWSTHFLDMLYLNINEEMCLMSQPSMMVGNVSHVSTKHDGGKWSIYLSPHCEIKTLFGWILLFWFISFFGRIINWCGIYEYSLGGAECCSFWDCFVLEAKNDFSICFYRWGVLVMLLQVFLELFRIWTIMWKSFSQNMTVWNLAM